MVNKTAYIIIRKKLISGFVFSKKIILKFILTQMNTVYRMSLDRFLFQS